MNTLRKNTIKIAILFFVLANNYFCWSSTNTLKSEPVKKKCSVVFEEIPGTKMTDEDREIILDQKLTYNPDEEILSTCIRTKIKNETDQLELAGIALYKRHSSDVNTITLLILAIKNSYKGNGIGTACIDYLAATTQCEKIRVVPMPKAVNFYKTIGFKQGLIETMLEKSFKNK